MFWSGNLWPELARTAVNDWIIGSFRRWENEPCYTELLSEENGMGGEVAMVLLSKGRMYVRHDYKGEATYALWRRDFFRRPRLKGRGHKVPFAPFEYGMVFIDADNHWVGSIQDYGYLTRHDIGWVLRSGMAREVLPEACKSQAVELLTSYSSAQGSGKQHTRLSPTDATCESLQRAIADAQDRAATERDERGWKQEGNTQHLGLVLPEPWRVDEWSAVKASDWDAFLQQIKNRGAFPRGSDMEAWRTYFSEHNLPLSILARFEAQIQEEALHETLPSAPQALRRPRMRI